jgi:hypothetical protein
MPLQTTTETEWVEIFPVWTVGVALEVSDLWQDSAFCKELTEIPDASQFHFPCWRYCAIICYPILSTTIVRYYRKLFFEFLPQNLLV